MLLNPANASPAGSGNLYINWVHVTGAHLRRQIRRASLDQPYTCTMPLAWDPGLTQSCFTIHALGKGTMTLKDPHHYLFVAADTVTPDEGFILSTTVIRERLRKGYWPIGERTRFRTRLSAGDRVVLYAAGRGGSAFVAAAMLVTDALHLPYRERQKLEYEYDYTLAAPYGVKLALARYFSRPVPARELLEQLSFVKTSSNWGTYFRGGVRQISAKDYQILINEGSPLLECHPGW